MIDMARKDILPAVTSYVHELADTASAVQKICDTVPAYEKSLISELSVLAGEISEKTDVLEKEVLEVHEISDILSQSYAYRDRVFVAMADLRASCDRAESLTSSKFWPFPTYGELLFGVR